MTARWDRRWPPPVIAAALRAKYGRVLGIGGYVHAELTCEYYDRSVSLRYPIHVGSWQRLRGRAQGQWLNHGRVAANTSVIALGFGVGDRSRGVQATVAVPSPLTGAHIAMRLPLGEVVLSRVLSGPPRPWRNWIHDPDWGRLWHPDIDRV